MTGPLGTGVREYPPAHRRLFFAGRPRTPPPSARNMAGKILDRRRRAGVPPAGRGRDPPAPAGPAGRGRAPDRTLRGRHRHALQAILTSPRFLFRVEESASAGRVCRAPCRWTNTPWPPGCPICSGPAPPTTSCAGWPPGGSCVRTCAPRSGGCCSTRVPTASSARFVGQWLQTRDVETVTVSGDNRPLADARRCAGCCGPRPSCCSATSCARTGTCWSCSPPTTPS